MNFIRVKLSNGENIIVSINKLELIYGATGIIVNKKYDGYGINPITKEKLELIYKNTSNNRFFVPAHNQNDYKYAKKNNLKIKQVVAPYFLGTKKEKPNPKIRTQVRYSVVGIISNGNDMYLCEDAKNRNCKSFVMGGIENGETPIEACIREVYEETGYKNIKIDFVCNYQVVNHFYAEYKGVNRYAYLNFVYGHLIDETCDSITEEENSKHTVLWVKKDKLKDFININLNKMALDILLNGEQAYTKDGIMITDDINNGKLSKEVRKNILNLYSDIIK